MTKFWKSAELNACCSWFQSAEIKMTNWTTKIIFLVICYPLTDIEAKINSFKKYNWTIFFYQRNCLFWSRRRLSRKKSNMFEFLKIWFCSLLFYGSYLKIVWCFPLHSSHCLKNPTDSLWNTSSWNTGWVLWDILVWMLFPNRKNECSAVQTNAALVFRFKFHTLFSKFIRKTAEVDMSQWNWWFPLRFFSCAKLLSHTLIERCSSRVRPKTNISEGFTKYAHQIELFISVYQSRKKYWESIVNVWFAQNKYSEIVESIKERNQYYYHVGKLLL